MRVFPVCLLVLLLGPWLVHATRLPAKTYTTADGLARDHVLCIVQDSHGFLWFCTAEGLSRFDGYQFTNYRTEQGLPADHVTNFLETREGVYWVATAGGVCRFDPAGTYSSRFHCYPLTSPSALYEDRAGGVWCGTSTGNDGLLHLGPRDSAFRRVDLSMTSAMVTALLLDRRGSLWVGTASGLYRRDPDGTSQSYTTADGLPNNYIMALLEDHEGRLWVGTRFGLARMDGARERGRAPGERPQMRVYAMKDGLPSWRIQSLLESSDGTVWVGTTEGLAEWIPRPSKGREFQSYSTAEGLSGKSVDALAEDRDGNLWIGTDGGGAMKVVRGGFTTYTQADGLPEPAQLLESRWGELCAVFHRPHAEPGIAVLDNRHFVVIRPSWPSQTFSTWGEGQIMLQDHAGEWWIATGTGLCRFSRADRVTQLSGVRPKAVYTTRDGLPADFIFRIFEDSRGDIWIGTIGPGTADGLAIWNRSTGSVHAFSETDGLPPKPVPTAFAEDRSGNVWVSLYHGGLARFRRGRFAVFTAGDGITGFLNTLFADSAGRLWVGGAQGLVRVDDPTQDRPRFDIYKMPQGLSSNDIGGLTEDRWGRIYAATGRGIDRFEPQAASLGRIKHYTTADGIAPGELDLALRDHQGTLWFGTRLGVSRLIPTEDRPRVPPPVLITGLSFGGVAHPISDVGQSAVSGLRLPEEPVRIDFVGLGFSPGETLRYQYMLKGADRDWSRPADQRSVLYASLSAGRYRFAVRAVTSEGTISPQPASVAFTILPPVWRTWWFLAACGTAGSLIVYGLYRFRLAQLLAVANVRTRIATDLHDDIGASLSQIAILSEVAQRKVNGAQPLDPSPLSDIAGISRELVDSMSDIVWAINPDHDRLSNLVYRMRRFATDLLGGQNVGLQFRSSVTDHDLRIDANVRRQVYLIFKEGIHNAARHSGADRVEVDLERVEDRLVLCLRDNGRGFDPAAEYGGHGLVSMRRRAAALGAQVEWRSAPGQGATLRLTVRLGSARTLSMLRGK